ncbi:MAG: translocation/assembly module TamB domain-containing protein [Bacteroidota bacterium]
MLFTILILVLLSFVLSFSSVQTSIADKVTASLSRKYGAEINIGKVDLSLLKDIKLNEVLIKDHHLDTLIYVKTASTSILNYRNLFQKDLEFGTIELFDGFFKMKTYKDEKRNNLTVFVDKFKDSTKTSKPFKMTSNSIELENVGYYLFDENKKETPIVFYKNITGFFDDFKIEGSKVQANIHDTGFIDHNDFVVTNFSTNYKYSNTGMQFYKTILQTENSIINADIDLNYEIGDLSNFVDKVFIDARISRADVSMYDVNKFYGQLGEYDKLHFTTHATGTIQDFVLNKVDLVSDRNSAFKGTIVLKQVLNKKKFSLSADINNLTSNYDHLRNLLPRLLGNKLSASLQKFGNFSSSGGVYLTSNLIQADLDSKSKLGSSKTNLELTNIRDIENANYTGEIELTDFKLGEFVGDSLIGELSMLAHIEGKGFTLDSINTIVKGNVTKHQYKGYTYSNVDVNGVFKNRHFNGILVVDDPNIKMNFSGLADLSQRINVFDFYANVEFANFNKLNLFTKQEKAVLRGEIKIEMQGNNIDNLIGGISISDASYSNENDDYYFKNFKITAEKIDSIKIVTIDSDEIVTGSIQGKFKFKQLEKLTRNAIGGIFINYQKEKVDANQFVDFNFNVYNKIVEVFFPEVKLASGTFMKGSIDSDNDQIDLLLKSPNIKAYDNEVENIKLQVNNQNPLYNTILSIDSLKTKYYKAADLNMVNVTLNDTLFVRGEFIGGKVLEEKFDLSFYYTINENNQPVFGIKRSEVKYKNNNWVINTNNNRQNKIVFDDNYKTFAIDNIDMISGYQSINIAGVHGEQNEDLNLVLENVNLNDISPDINNIEVDGKINGTIQLKNVGDKSLPYVDIEVNYFSVNDLYYGDLAINASGDETINSYNFNAELDNGDLKSFITSGNINFNSDIPKIDAEVGFENFKINAFSPLGKGVLSKIRGLATGEARISGNFRNPDIEGEISLKNAGIAFPYLNVNYDFGDDSKVLLYKQTFDFQPITITDTEKKTQGIIAGTIEHKSFKEWYLDLNIRTDNLLVLHTEEKEDAIYYGTGLLKGITSIMGPTDNLMINVEGTTNPGTEFIIPLSYISTVGESKLIHFIDPNKLEVETSQSNDIVFEELKGLTLNFNLNVTKDAVAQVVIDKVTGSVLKGSGDGNLRLNIDTNGKFEMFGELVVYEGEYQFKNIINKDFDVQRGGTIIWAGNPYDARLNIEAVNHTKANPAVLLDEITSSRKIDVDLITRITGSLSDAKFDFDIEIPNSSTLVSSELDFKLSSEDEKLTQFFSVLATGSFINQDQAGANMGNAAIAGTLAEKASSVLSNILQSSDDYFQVGVTYDVGQQNSVEDVNTDDQLGILVSGRIGNKLVVSGKVGVPVGSNTTSSVVGEVELVYPLNEQETLLAKAYNRQNEIQFDIVDSEGYTQGAGISYTFDFDNNKEFMEKVGIKNTEEEKNLTKFQKDSIKEAKKLAKKQARQERKEERKRK